ncbi:hypothetical protein SUGI_0136260 [Cryptomeria japonica]|uniref:protein SENESCENCE-ASSOCIATED GENE 21, mitochondrial n=1 Tax=Cryptomeria japonica TaxID=3369 RepID=UPI002408B545|nr:protein SENESCENCE-ASSOCIATED GENE 21, mitochondrial [Cryptomeria japonica]GLJ10838.1 hypothetical protein SUGI_0136260 [Cryptomeria japonica]
MERLMSSHLKRLWTAHTHICRRSFATQGMRSSSNRGVMAAQEEEMKKPNSGGGEKGFWMRDPATGNWIPQDHFHDIDVAELREKLLSTRSARQTFN